MIGKHTARSKCSGLSLLRCPSVVPLGAGPGTQRRVHARTAPGAVPGAAGPGRGAVLPAAHPPAPRLPTALPRPGLPGFEWRRWSDNLGERCTSHSHHAYHAHITRIFDVQVCSKGQVEAAKAPPDRDLWLPPALRLRRGRQQWETGPSSQCLRGIVPLFGVARFSCSLRPS